MATGGDKSKTQSPLRDFFGSLLSTKSHNNVEDANKSSSSDRLESGNQTRRGSLPPNFPDASTSAPLNIATGTASGVIKDTGAKKKLPVVVPATDKFNLSFMPQATPQQAAQQTAPAVIGPLTPNVNNSIPTGSGTAQTGYWPGTGIYQGVQGGSGGPPDKGGNPSSQPSTNNSSDNLMATLVQVLDTFGQVLASLAEAKTREANKPDYSGLEKPKMDVFSGDASVYAHWKKKFLLLYNPERKLSNAYLANSLHGLLQGEARRKVEVHFTADWNGDNYHRMWEHLDREYGSQHTQDRCIQDRAAEIPPLDAEKLKSFSDFYDGVTVQANYYLVRQPSEVLVDNSLLYQQMRQKISYDLLLQFVEWTNQHVQEGQPQRSLLTLQAWLFERMEVLREVETFSSSAKLRSSHSPAKSKQTGSIDPVEDESDSDTDPDHSVILTYASGKQVRHNRVKDKYYRYKPSPEKELSRSASMCASTKTNAVILQTLVCNMSGRKGRKGSKIVAFLDPGSTQTFVDQETAVRLRLKRTSKTHAMTVNVFNQQVSADSYRVELYLASIDGSHTVTIDAHAVQDLAKQLPVVDWSREKDSFSHLQNVPFESLPSERSINLLIGYDHAALLEFSEMRKGTPGQPIARLTPLGWSCSVSPDKI
jgi:hypothetical protein